MLGKLRALLTEAAHRYSLFGKIAEVANKRRHASNERYREALDRLRRTEAHRNEHRAVGTIPHQADDDNQMVAIAEHAVKKAKRKREFWRKRYVWASQRHAHWGSVLRHRRDRVRRFILQHRGFQPYMANKKPWVKLTPEARHAIYLDFRHGLYVTSTYEGHPGDGVHATSSYHYLQNQPDGRARCWDAGSARRGPMVKAQRREAGRCPSFLVEMFGPENDLAYKNGLRFTLEEGSELENMHDNHKHEDLRDGAPLK